MEQKTLESLQFRLVPGWGHQPRLKRPAPAEACRRSLVPVGVMFEPGLIPYDVLAV
jgi:hypothetical protein